MQTEHSPSSAEAQAQDLGQLGTANLKLKLRAPGLFARRQWAIFSVLENLLPISRIVRMNTEFLPGKQKDQDTFLSGLWNYLLDVCMAESWAFVANNNIFRIFFFFSGKNGGLILEC